MRIWATALTIAFVLAGCLHPPAIERPEPTAPTTPPTTTRTPSSGWQDPDFPRGPCDDNTTMPDVTRRAITIPPHKGTGRMTLDMDRATLRPGENTTFKLTFQNPDCLTFFYYVGFCHGATLAIGNPPLRFRGWDEVTLETLGRHGCPVQLEPDVVAVGGRYENIAVWDGSVWLYDHSLVEQGQQLGQRKFWVAAGQWPMWFGFPQSSYPVGLWTNLTVEETEENRGSFLGPGRCETVGLGAEWPPLEQIDVEIEVSPREATLGTPVTVWANYTVPLPATGCLLVTTIPKVVVWRGEEMVRYGLDGSCGYSSKPILVTSHGPTVTGRLRYEYDGTGGQHGCSAPGTPGTDTLQLSFHSARDPTSATITWREP